MEKHTPEWSRRTFATTMAGTGAFFMLQPFMTWAYQNDLDPRVAKIVAKTLGIDSHNHIDVPLVTAELPGPLVDLAGDLKKSGLAAIVMTFAVDYQKLTAEGQAYERFTNGLNAMDVILKNNQVQRAFYAKDLQKAHKEKQPIVIQSVEGGHFLEGKIERLQVAYDRGLRHLGLLHDNDASVPLGDIYTNPPRWGGLTEFGAQVIKECNRLGILIDLTHCSNDTINAALKVSTKPMMVSHTGLDTQLGQNANMAKMMKPRLISKEQAKIVADAGGIIGAWKHLTDTPLEYAQNVRALVDVVGVDHVCIGTDSKLTPPYRAPRKPEESAQSPAPNGGNPPAERIGERSNLVWKDQKEGFYFTVVDALLKTGFNEKEIAKIGGGNLLRLFKAATGK